MRKRTKEEAIKSRRREVEEVKKRDSVGGKRACFNFNFSSSLSGVFRSCGAFGGGGVWECAIDGDESDCVLVVVLVWTLVSATSLASASVSVSKILVPQNNSFTERRAVTQWRPV